MVDVFLLGLDRHKSINLLQTDEVCKIQKSEGWGKIWLKKKKKKEFAQKKMG